MTQTGNHQLIAQVNRSLVLSTIRENGPISRPAIAKCLNLSTSTATLIVNQLESEDLVRPCGAGPSHGGRKPTLFEFNSRGRYILAAEIETNYVTVAMVDMAGAILDQERGTFPSCTPDLVVTTLGTLGRRLLGRSNLSDTEVLGLGVSCPGRINTAQGIVEEALNLDWNNVSLGNALRAELGFNVKIGNDANVAALGEHYFGAATAIDNLVFIVVETGIGAGIILDNRIYDGASNNSGEMGHMIVATNGLQCSCGERGCLEMYSSIPAILSRMNQRILSGTKSLVAHQPIGKTTFAKVLEAAQGGDTLARGILEEATEYLVAGTLSVVRMFNPNMVVFGGPLADSDDIVLKQVSLAVHRRFPQIAVFPSALGKKAKLIGAATLILTDFLATTHLQPKL